MHLKEVPQESLVQNRLKRHFAGTHHALSTFGVTEILVALDVYKLSYTGCVLASLQKSVSVQLLGRPEVNAFRPNGPWTPDA